MNRYMPPGMRNKSANNVDAGDNLASQFGGISMEERLLTCTICKDYYEEPRLLPCSHTLCSHCLVDLRTMGDHRCPECRLLCTIPLQQLPINLTVKTLAAEKKRQEAHANVGTNAGPSPVEEFMVNVMDLHGKTHRVHGISANTKVAELKAKIRDKTGMPVEQQRLIYRGKPLEEDGKNVTAYGIEKNSTIHLVLRQIGGQAA